MSDKKKVKVEEIKDDAQPDPNEQLLDTVQQEIEKLNDEATEEILQIEKKYNGLRKPYYKKRNDIIRKIPGFWLKAFSNHSLLADLLDERDQEVFQFLKELTVEDFEDVKSGFKIIFSFDSNPFFTNKTLTKEFHYSSEGELKVTSSPISWKENKDLTKPNGSAAVGSKRKEEEPQTFFAWFDPEDQDLELGEIIKEELWPDPSKFYHGDVDDEDDEGEEGDEAAEESLGEEEGEDGDE